MDDTKPIAPAHDVPPRPASRGGAVAGWLVLLLILGALLAVAWWAMTPREAADTRTGRFAAAGPMPVAVALAQTGDLPISLNALGSVTPVAAVTVKTQISGRLTRVAFEEGQVVKEGDVLAEIDPRPYQAALANAEGQLMRDQALLRNAEIDLERYRVLVRQDSLARQQRDNQEYLVRQYQGVVKSDQAMVETARLNLAYCTIVAPIAGRVGLRLVDQGNYVTSGDATGIVVITRMKPIAVVFSVPEDNVPAITRRLRAGATLPVTAYDRARSAVLGRGSVTTIDNQIDSATGTVRLKAQFDNDDEILFPNQFVNIELALDVLRGAVIVPTAAVQRGGQGSFVYVVKPDSTVAVAPVKLGPQDGERVVLSSGLEAGARVVVDGADRLRDGARVAIPADAGAEAAPAGPARPPGARGADAPPTEGRPQGRRKGAP
ncbi:MAG: MdtA/MuxA family multidrug efflux RND transporter periplasmic adaptor subunit [Alphaproteobacteria bacterium]|nr:MdtA/MuxA family multidrug efflux RND transporter periplasmic adaptor subunit [Alphaproteobacteria bacterium]